MLWKIEQSADCSCPVSRVLAAVLLLATGAVWAQGEAFGAEDAGVASAVEAAPADTPEADAGLALSPEDEQLLKEIEAATGTPVPETTAPPAAATAPPAPRGSNPFSNLFNPAMSLNGLFLGWAGGPVADRALEAGITLQEAELQVMANVDPYFSANFILAIPGLEGLEVEEGYLSALPQPLGLGFRVGKMRVPFGRENALHTHALPFVDRALANQDVFGEEGMSEVGVEVAWLAPLPWYALLTVTGMNGDNETLYGSPWGRDFAGFAGLRNVFDVSDDATLEAGVSYTLGNNLDRQLAQALGAHLTFKWRPATDARNSSAMATVEALVARRPSGARSVDDPPAPADESAGARAEVQWQLTRGWFVGGRVEVLRQQVGGFDFSSSPTVGRVDVTTRESLILAFVPTEFSAFRLQGNVTQSPAFSTPVIEGFLQANFTIGAHPAHSY